MKSKPSESIYRRFFATGRDKVAGIVEIAYRSILAFLLVFIIPACGQAQTTNTTAVLFNTVYFTGQPLNNPIEVTSLNTPYSISNGLVGGLTFTLYPTNGIAATNMYPGDYRVQLGGIYQPWIITVTPTTNLLNAAAIPKAGVSGQNIYFWTNPLAGITVNLSQVFYTNQSIAAGTNATALTNGLLVTISAVVSHAEVAALGTSITNGGLAALSNYVLLVGANCTNESLLIGAAATNNDLLLSNNISASFIRNTNGFGTNLYISGLTIQSNVTFAQANTINFSGVFGLDGPEILAIDGTDKLIGETIGNGLQTVGNSLSVLPPLNALQNSNGSALINLNLTFATNNDQALGTSITNGAIANLSNYIATISLNATNQSLLIGLNGSNNVAALGTSITNGGLSVLSNYVLLVSQNATNEALLIGANGTNNVLAVSNNFLGTFIKNLNGIGTNTSLYGTNVISGAGPGGFTPELRLLNSQSTFSGQRLDDLYLRWAGDVSQIGNEFTGTGTSHDMALISSLTLRLLAGTNAWRWNLDGTNGNFYPVIADTNSIVNLKNVQAVEALIGGTNYSDGTGLTNVKASAIVGSFNPLNIANFTAGKIAGSDAFSGTTIVPYTLGPGLGLAPLTVLEVSGGLLQLYTNWAGNLTNLNLTFATNNDQLLGTGITNGAIANLSNYVSTVSQNATNEALLIGSNGTNNTAALGTSITNGAIANLSNYVSTVSQNATNESLKIGGAATNNDQLLGTSITNGAIANLSNYVSAVSLNATNEALMLAAGITNGFIQIVSGAGTNTLIDWPSSGSYHMYLHQYSTTGAELLYAQNSLAVVDFVWRAVATNFFAKNVTIQGAPMSVQTPLIMAPTDGIYGLIDTGNATNNAGSRVAYLSDVVSLTGGLPNLVTNNGILLTNIPVSGIKATNAPLYRLFLTGGDGTSGGWLPAISLPVANTYLPSGSDASGSNIVAWSLGNGLANVTTNMYVTNVNGTTQIISGTVSNSSLANPGVTVTATANQTTISGGSPLNLGGTLIIGTVQNINPGASAYWNLINSTNLLLSGVVSPTNGVALANTVDLNVREATTNISGAVSFTSLSNLNSTNYCSARRWIVNTSGSDQTITVATGWRTDSGRTTSTTYTATNSTVLRLDFRVQQGMFTNVESHFFY